MGEPVNAGIVMGLKTDQQIGIFFSGQTCQELFQSDRTDFGRSTARLGQTHQGRFLKQFYQIHDSIPYQLHAALGVLFHSDGISRCWQKRPETGRIIYLGGYRSDNVE